MEPNMNQIDDYNNHESKEKRIVILAVVGFIVALILSIQGLKNYYDVHMPESFNPVVVK